MRRAFGSFYKMIKKIALFVSVLIFLAGCSSFSSKQEPAPVYRKVDLASKKRNSHIQAKAIILNTKIFKILISIE